VAATTNTAQFIAGTLEIAGLNKAPACGALCGGDFNEPGTADTCNTAG
jgi:hypothetical protein